MSALRLKAILLTGAAGLSAAASFACPWSKRLPDYDFFGVLWVIDNFLGVLLAIVALIAATAALRTWVQVLVEE